MTALFAPAHTPKARKRVFAVLALLGAWAVLAISGATPALAHATVVGSDPAESSRLQAAPSKVTMIFSEDVTLGAGYLKVVDSKSNIVSEGTAKIDGRNVTVPLKSGLGDGSYIVSYRITSADSHPIGGAYAFVVGNGPLVAATGSVVGGGTNGVISKTFDVARFVGFLGIVLLGGLAFVVLCWPAGRTDPRARKLIWYGWWATAAGAVLGLILQGPYAAGTGVLDLLNSSLLKTTLGDHVRADAVRPADPARRAGGARGADPARAAAHGGEVQGQGRGPGRDLRARRAGHVRRGRARGGRQRADAGAAGGHQPPGRGQCLDRRADHPGRLPAAAASDRRSWPRRCRATPGWHSAAWPCSP